jgi:hypothetical protein
MAFQEGLSCLARLGAAAGQLLLDKGQDARLVRRIGRELVQGGNDIPF